MTTVNTAVVELKLNTKDFDSGIKSAQRELNNFGSSGVAGAEKFSAKWSAIMGAIGGVAASVFNKVTDAISKSMDAGVKRFDTMNNFPNVMKNLGISADSSKKSIETISEALKGLPTSLDSAAMGVQRLTSKNGDVSKSTELFLAMNNAILAGGASSDIQSSAIEQLSQAYAKGKPDMMEWRTLLMAMPAQLKQVATAMGYIDADALGEDLRNGRVSMDDFMNTIVKLNSEGINGLGNFEEQARAATGGIQTGLTNMQNAFARAWQKILDAIGSENINNAIQNIISSIDSLGGVLSGIIDFIKNNKEVIGGIAAVIGGATTAIIALTSAMNLWKTITTAITAAQIALNVALNANPIGIIITLVAALVAGLVYFFTQTEAGQGIIQTIGDIATTIFTAIGDAISTVVDWVSNLVQQIGEFLKPVIDVIAVAFQTWWAITSKIIEIFIKVGEIIWTVFIVAIQAVGNKVREIFSPLTQFFANLWNGIKAIFAPIAQFFGDMFSKAFNRIKSIFSGLAGFFRGVWDGIVGIFSGVGTAIGNAVGGAFRNVVNGVLGFVESFINTPINLINDAIGAINNIPGVSIGKLSGVSLPRMATGGIVEARRGGTPVILGEGGQNEWVVPESKMADLIAKLGGGVGTSVVQNNTINTPVDLQIMNQRLGNAVRRATA